MSMKNSFSCDEILYNSMEFAAGGNENNICQNLEAGMGMGEWRVGNWRDGIEKDIPVQQ